VGELQSPISPQYPSLTRLITPLHYTAACIYTHGQHCRLSSTRRVYIWARLDRATDGGFLPDVMSEYGYMPVIHKRSKRRRSISRVQWLMHGTIQMTAHDRVQNKLMHVGATCKRYSITSPPRRRRPMQRQQHTRATSRVRLHSFRWQQVSMPAGCTCAEPLVASPPPDNETDRMATLAVWNKFLMMCA
jgi:hypothetical protein